MPRIPNRDYIPDNENATVAERAHYDNLRAMVRGGVQQDFIPGPDHKLKRPAPNGSKRALEKALRDSANAVVQEFEAAKKRLAQLNISEAVQLIRDLPIAVQERYLVAEAVTGQREAVLAEFPQPSPEVWATYQPSTEKNASNQSGGSFDDGLDIELPTPVRSGRNVSDAPAKVATATLGAAKE